MMRETRQTALGAALIVALGVTAAWNLHGMWERREQAQRAWQDAGACRDLAKSIEELRSRPTMASSEAMGVQELGARIEAAMRQAELEAAALDGVFPQNPQRVNATPYVRKPTAMALRGVSLRQVATFLYGLTEDARLTVQDLRLRTPLGEAAGDRWNAEATVTYLMYVPAARERVE